MRNDRHIHARTADGTLIVRYDRAGKWYAERPPGDERLIGAKNLTLAQAVEMATQEGSYVYPGQPGGRRFDAMVSKVWS